MKTKVLSLLSALFFAGSLLAQTSGGPDAFGYAWKNNSDPNGPAVMWKSIKGVGTQIMGLADDNSKGPFNMNFNFRFYWTNYSKFMVGSNGWIGFTGAPGNIAAPFPALPDPTAKNTIDPLLSDLTFVQKNNSAVPGASAWYWTNNTDTLIVQYDSVSYWTANNAANFDGRYSFQVILSAVDSSVTFQYHKMTAGSAAYDLTGEKLATGISNSTGTIGLQVLNSVFPTDSSAVKFSYPNPVTYQVFDATPAWNGITDNAGFFVSANCTPVMLMTDIANAGNQPDSNISVTGQLFDPTFTPIWSSSSFVASLAIGDDSVKTYPTPFTGNKAGDYTFRTTTTMSNDINPANDIDDVEMVVVDTTQANATLAFTTATTTTNGLNWQGGNGGGGVYFKPPFYPCTIVSADHFIAANTGNKDFSSVIKKDDGPAGSPGTTLDSVHVASSSVIVGQYNTVLLTTTLTITSGGVYVGWYQGGDSIALGVDQSPPLSNRNWEIIGGAWAPYRSNSTSDLMIRLNLIGANTGMNLTVATTSLTCSNPNGGTATANVTGGAPPYTYMWSTGATTSSVTGLSAGSYSVSITDSKGCFNPSSTFTLTANPFTVTSSHTNVSCNGGADGTATATPASGGTAPYTYAWSPSGGNAQTASGLSAGTYTVMVTDAGGCTATQTATVTQPSAVAVNISSTIATSCTSCTDGKATASASGGTGPYTYSWNTTPVQNSATATGLGVGTYTVCVTDSKGCTMCNTASVTDGTGITEIFSDASITISPNPFSDFSTVKIDFANPSHTGLNFVIYDMYGKQIETIDLRTLKGASVNFTLDRNNLPAGLYFYKLIDDKKTLNTGKVVVQ